MALRMKDPIYFEIIGQDRPGIYAGPSMTSKPSEKHIIEYDEKRREWWLIKSVIQKPRKHFDHLLKSGKWIRLVDACTMLVEASSNSDDQAAIKDPTWGSKDWKEQQNDFFGRHCEIFNKIDLRVVDGKKNPKESLEGYKEVVDDLLRKVDHKPSPAHVAIFRALIKQKAIHKPVTVCVNTIGVTFAGLSWLAAISLEGYPPITLRIETGYSTAAQVIMDSHTRKQSMAQMLAGMGVEAGMRASATVAAFLLRYYYKPTNDHERAAVANELIKELEKRDFAYAVSREFTGSSRYAGARAAIVVLTAALGIQGRDFWAAVCSKPVEDAPPEYHGGAWKAREWLETVKGKLSGGQSSQLLVFKVVLKCGLSWLDGDKIEFKDDDFSIMKKGEIRGMITIDEAREWLQCLQKQVPYQPLPAEESAKLEDLEIKSRRKRRSRKK